MTDALFRRDGETFRPHLLCTGPWRADAMHGGPPAALVGRAIMSVVDDGEHVARVNVELERPVPLKPLTVMVERRRVSRRVTHVDVAVSTVEDSTLVVSGRALVLAVDPMPEPAWRPRHEAVAILDESRRAEVPAWASGSVPTTYHQHAVEHRMPPGSAFTEAGAATSWIRLLQPLVAGEPTSPLSLVLAAADFGSGISSIYRMTDGHGLINADLSIALERPAAGEWVLVDAVTTIDASGSALCVSRLADERGPLGVGTQSLLGLRS